jgi:hypothetical protein
MLVVRIPDDLDTRLTNIAKKTGRMADIRSGKSKTIPLEDLMAEYGLND